MAFDVTKRIGRRLYRYRVERVIDPESGRRKNRWTYLGPAGVAEDAAPVRRRTGDARQRLLDAFEALLAELPYDGVTAGAIAQRAGLGHGTFYRHFKDKADAFRAGLLRLRERRGPALDALDGEAPEADARAALRAAVERVLRKSEHSAFARALPAAAERDPSLARERSERSAHAIAMLTAFITRLAGRGIAHAPHPDALAATLFALLAALYGESLERPFGDPRLRAACDAAERIVFGA